jgi:hypothetical protein
MSFKKATMERRKVFLQKVRSLFILSVFLGFISCSIQPVKESLSFTDYPNLKIGLSTQDFQLAMPMNIESISQIIQFASKEGFQFIEIRDVLAKLTTDECKAIAKVASKNKIDIIYVINKNPLDTGFFKVFDRALANTLILPGPGILRTLASKSEFEADPLKKGWDRIELKKLSEIVVSCASVCATKNVRFVLENSNEAFFGNDSVYFGISDLLANVHGPLFQLDIANLFRNSARVKPTPEKVLKFLPTLGNQWVITHLKTIQGGEPQPILTDNPITVEEIVQMAGKQNVQFVMLELAAVPDINQCFENHRISIKILKNKGILK